jgi:hypothetical protein
MTSHIERRQPSASLITQIDACLLDANSLKGRIDKVMALGKAEGFTELEMGDIVRERDNRLGLPNSTIRY